MAYHNPTSVPPCDKPDHLLIFTKHPVAGYAKTRLIPSQGAAAAADISRMLTEHTIMTARWLRSVHATLCTMVHYAAPTGLPAERTAAWLRPEPPAEVLLAQTGGSLGDRLIAAFRYSFTHGARKVAVIGTDAPHITPVLLRQAFSVLDDADVVIGPALDGGYYLIAMSALHEPLFQDIPWSSDTVCTDTLNKARQIGLSVEMLAPLRDIDELDDLLHIPTSVWYDSKAGTFGKP